MISLMFLYDSTNIHGRSKASCMTFPLRNLADGRVEILAEGPQEPLFFSKFVWVDKGDVTIVHGLFMVVE